MFHLPFEGEIEASFLASNWDEDLAQSLHERLSEIFDKATRLMAENPELRSETTQPTNEKPISSPLDFERKRSRRC